MNFRTSGVAMVVCALLVSIAALGRAQETKVKKTTVTPSNPSSGATMFKQYCAVCHGPGGKGDGPAASALNVPPPDLTTLSKRHDGKFPDAYVQNVLHSGISEPAHGNAEMPVWGPLFQTMSRNDDAQVTMRINNLTKYLKSIQPK